MTKSVEPPKETENPTSQPVVVVTSEAPAQVVVSPAPQKQAAVIAPQAPPVESTPQEPAAVITTPAPEPSPRSDASENITWTASEFFGHEKTIGWYTGLATVTIILAAVLYILTKGVVTVAVVVVCGIVLGIYGTHKPKQIEYALTRQGIRIGPKQYLYDEFQLFITTPPSAYPEVTLMPLKRFMPPISLRYEAADESKILERLSDHLPSEERRPDLLDSFMHSIRF